MIRAIAGTTLTGMTEDLLGDKGPVRLVFLASDGLRPGLEALAILPLVIAGRALGPRLGVHGILGSAVLTGLLCLNGMIIVARRRKVVAIASTDESVYLLRTSGFRSPRPVEVIEALPRTGSVKFLDDGDKRVVVAGRKYWVNGMHEDNARRMSRV